MSADRPYRVYKLDTGTVIDHIPAGMGIRVIGLLGLDRAEADIVTLGINLESDKLGRKDVVKVEDRFLTDDEMDRLCIIAPSATVNLLKDHTVQKKHKVEAPFDLREVAECPNPNCVTNNQDEPSRFTRERDGYRCHYCERLYAPQDLRME